MTRFLKGTTPLYLRNNVSNLSCPIQRSSLDIDSNSLINLRKVRNSTLTIPHIFSMLNKYGFISNFDAVINKSEERKGMWFSDSDVYKSLESAIWASREDNSILRRIGYDEIVETIRSAQDLDGYINSYFQVSAKDLMWKDHASGHEMYTAGHLFQAAIAEARVLGSGPLMQTATKFADLLVAKFGADAPYRADGHPLVETALVELYRETNNHSYLDLAKKLLEGRGRGLIAETNSGSFHPSSPKYIQDHMGIRESDSGTGHCVRQMYLNLGVTDLYLETNDKKLLETQESMWEDITFTKMYLHGGIGSRHRDESFGNSFELPNDRAYAETCASIGLFMWTWKLLLATGKSRYSDLMEILIYNIIAGSISQSGTHFFYSNPLHRRRNHLVSFDEESSERMDWFRVSCCPPNIARLFSTIEMYACSENQDSVFIHQFFSGNFSSRKFNPWRFSLKSSYPNTNKITITIEEISSHVLHIRAPRRITNLQILVNQIESRKELDENGYIILKDSKAGDKIEVLFEFKYEYVYPHHLVDSSRNCVAIQKGPVIYALDQSVNKQEVEVERCAILLDSSFREVPKVDDFGEEYTDVEVNGVQFNYEPNSPSFMSEPYKMSVSKYFLRMTPYHRWGNPVTGGMRVWIPIAQRVQK